MLTYTSMNLQPGLDHSSRFLPGSISGPGGKEPICSNLGPLELFAIFIVAPLVFGHEKLPDIGRQVGRAVREFRRMQSSFQADLGDALDGHLTGPVPPGPAPAGARPPHLLTPTQGPR